MIQNHVCAYNTECYICMFAIVDTEGMERLSTEKTDIWQSNNHETSMAQEMFEGFVCRFYLALFHQFIEDGHWMIEPTKYNLYIYMYLRQCNGKTIKNHHEEMIFSFNPPSYPGISWIFCPVWSTAEHFWHLRRSHRPSPASGPAKPRTATPPRA